MRQARSTLSIRTQAICVSQACERHADVCVADGIWSTRSLAHGEHIVEHKQQQQERHALHAAASMQPACGWGLCFNDFY